MKKWYLSKTLWTALLSFIAIALAEIAGYELQASVQAAIISAIMVVLRIVTKEPLEL